MAKQKTPRLLSRGTNAFIFQARLNRFDLRTELKAGVRETWEATRYRLAMRVGDVVYFWLAGAETVRGIYGWGQIKRPPYRRVGDVTYSVDVLVQQVFSSPLLVPVIRRERDLRELLILKAPQATNFLLSDSEARAVAELAGRQGELAPPWTSSVRRSSSVTRATGPTRDRVFISYSHADADILRRLQVHLVPLKRAHLHEIWDDTRIAPGQLWRDEIRKALRAAKAGVLLVSADFLASPFIMEDEVPQLLGAAADEGAVILPVIVSPCRFVETTSLSRFQSVNPPSRPLSLMTAHEREMVFYQVSAAVEGALARAHTGHD